MKTPHTNTLKFAALLIGALILSFHMLTIDGGLTGFLLGASVLGATLQSRYRTSGETIDVTAVVALTAGEIIQLPDGRAAQVIKDVAAGDSGSVRVCGKINVNKTANINLLDGQNVYWDHSANTATFRRNNDRDFRIGTASGDSLAAATTVDVVLNNWTRYDIEFGRDAVTTEATNGLGVTDLVGQPGVMLSFDAVIEAAQAAIYSADTVAIGSNPIMEAWLSIYDIGDDAALDISAALASGSHATDFQSVAEFAGIHLDGAALDILVESDDGTTDVAPVDSTINAVDDTKLFLQIDARDLDDVQIYINGVDAVPAGTTLALTAATGPLKPIVHIEKTSNDTTADVRVHSLGVRTSEL